MARLAKWLMLPLLAAQCHSGYAQIPVTRRPDAGSLLNQTAPPIAEPTLPTPALPAVTDESPDGVAGDGQKIRVAHFLIEGAELLPTRQLQEKLADLVGQELGLSGLREAAARITRLYREAGYFLARAYLPTQDVVEGVVRIVVVEGRYDGVEASDSPRLKLEYTIGILDAQRVASGQPIERAGLERSLILLEQRSGAPVRAVLQPGATIGTSRMLIEVPSGPLFSGQLGVDNYGNRYSGEGRGTALLNLNSPRGLGDVASLWLMGAADSDAVYAAYQTPVGFHGLTLGASYSRFHYQLCCEFAPLQQTGYAEVFGAQARYPLQLSQHAITNAGFSVERKYLNDRSIFGELDAKNATVVSLSADGLAATASGRNRYQLALTMGDLHLAGPPAFVKANAATVDTAGRYAKVRGEYQYLHFIENGQRILFRFAGQASDRNLDSSEKFLLGGVNGVRAYPEGEAAGDQALLARLDWLIPLPAEEIPGSLAARLFVDTGKVWLVKDIRGGRATFGIPNEYGLSGVGFGVDLRLPNGVTATLDAATRLGSNPGASIKGNDADGRDDNSRAWLGLTWAY